MSADKPAQTPDPTLASLVPQPSGVRNVVVIALGVVALVAASVLGTASRLDLHPDAMGAELLPSGQIVYVATFAGGQFPGTRVTAVRPPEGAHVAATWVLGPDDPDPLSDAGGLASAVAVMQKSDARTTLPQSVPSSGLRLLLLLDVQDCDRFTDDAPSSANTSPTIVEVRSLLGSTTDVALESFTWAQHDLEATGVCG